MPFKSEKQRRFMWAKHPDIARRWTDKYGSAVQGAEKAMSKRKKKKHESKH